MEKQPCSIPDCDAPVTAKGLCKKHYYAKRRADVLSGAIPSPECTVDGCSRPVWAKGLCSSHYTSQRDKARRAAVRAESRPCVVCGADLAGRAPNAMYCSVRCKERSENAKRRERKGHKAKVAARYQRRSGAVRAKMLEWAYGLSGEDFDRLYNEQEGLCAICRTDQWDTRSNSPHVDHCHTTHVVRGLLCQHCNNGLGRFKDDPALLRAAADYLDRFT